MDIEFCNYNNDDCREIEKIFARSKNSLFTLLKYVVYPEKEICIKLSLVLGEYKLVKMSVRSPTRKQLYEEHSRAYKTAQKLHQFLKSAGDHEDAYFFGAIMSAIVGGEIPHKIDEKEYDSRLAELESNLTDLDKSLTWFIDSVSLCLEDGFKYWDTKPSLKREKPETKLIQGMSNILTGYFETGGYARDAYSDRNSVSGWRIDCLEYLLRCADITITRNQIFDALP